jgi:hypothetical protein
MFKKIYLSLALSLVAIAPAQAMSITDVAGLTTQLNNINTQMNAIKRAWNTERAHIKMAEKASTALYASVKPVLEKIIASDDFTTKMNTVIDTQFDSIINNNTPFSSIKTENSLSDFFPNLTMSEYGRKLYTAMANKAYCLRLGQKLADKAREIAASIKSAQEAATSTPQTSYE